MTITSRKNKTPAPTSVGLLEHNVVRSKDFISGIIRRATLNYFLAVRHSSQEFFGPLHPIDACIDVMLIGTTNLEDACDPVIIALLVDTLAITLNLSLFNG
ncbi:hypothetical protein V3481_017124 [Fusarium oxysporum f. sp. vasinfectum]